MDIYQDYLSKEEIAFITGCKQKHRMVKQLNIMGIPFVQNAHGDPIVRRDYNHTKPKHSRKSPPANEVEWQSNVLRNV